MKSVLFGAVLLAVALASATLAAASPASQTPTPSAAATPAWTYTLYGSFAGGWGLTNTSAAITSPGPTLTVTTGDNLDLHLFAADNAEHTWFIDVDNNSAHGTSEPISNPFSWSLGPVWYNLSITLAPGTYTYRCSVHPGTMWGELVVQAAPTFTLWGSYSPVNGWGLANNSITQPGPTLNVSQGQTVTVDLFSADGIGHTFYVDFAKSGSTSGNTVSATFNGTHPVRFSFVASAAGNFTYACGIHGQNSMSGVLHVAAQPAPPSGPDYTVYAVAIVVIVIVAIVAAVFIRRKPKSPPAQPPENPPTPPQG